ncbi:hypothetical protein MMC25_006099 [Agyrium rufum]|nr:hypothetical protein [Agyrium rufum]
MSIAPIITFKAGNCEFDQSSNPPKVIPQPTAGYIYLYSEDELMHFCWRPRDASLSNPTLDLIMFPGDCHFLPHQSSPKINSESSTEPTKSVTNGRIYVLKFSSSSQRHFFWLQSKSQHPQGTPNFFSQRDTKLGELVDQLLQGEEVDVEEEIRNIPSGSGDGGPPPGGDEDATMEDADESGPGPEHNRSGSGGAGIDATGGDFREEGEESREQGADGGRAPSNVHPDAAAAVRNFLQSMSGGKQQSQQQRTGGAGGQLYTTLPDLLPPSTTLPILETASESTLDNLLTHVPPMLLLLAQEIDDIGGVDPTSETAQAAMAALSLEQKKDILRRVLRSPQFSQSLGSLTSALRDGGLPMVADALKIKVTNGGYVRGGSMPLGGGEAVETFVEGVKKEVEEEAVAAAGKKGEKGEGMDVDS